MALTKNRLIASAVAIVCFMLLFFMRLPMVSTVILPSGAAAQTTEAAPPISAAQLKKVTDYLAAKGTVVTADKGITDGLGLSGNNETVSSRALTVRDRETGVMHQIQMLPQAKGYLIGGLAPNARNVYWADQNLVLISAIVSVWTTVTTKVPLNEAQNGYRKELAYWAMVADTL